MLTIALDESDGFEKEQAPNVPVFIAGLIYDDNGNSADENNERERATRYLRAVCDSVGCCYPTDLHVNDTGNHAKVKAVKTRLGETMSEFFRVGTYQGRALLPQRRTGRYLFFSILKSPKGKRDILMNNVSSLLKEDTASNLYAHMSYDVVSRLILHNPIIDNVKSVKLELPTRVVVIEDASQGEGAERFWEYIRLGYRENKYSNESRKTLQIANADGYRAAIQREMLESGKTDINIEEIAVRSIYYEKNDKKKMTYLYLADAICSHFSFHTTPYWLDSFYALAHTLNGSTRNLIFAYDSVDTYFNRAWKAYERGDYFDALSIIYDAGSYRGEYLSFYKKHWFPMIEQKIVEDADKESFKIAASKLRSFSHTSNLNQEKLTYIFDILERIVNFHETDNRLDQSSVFELYDTGMAAFNHVADTKNARRCFQKCREYANYTNIEDYLRTLNKQIVFLMDDLDFDLAKESADEALLYEEEMLSVKKLLYKDETASSFSYARSLSQSGQVYAALQNSKAEALFLQALEIFPDDSPDYYITLSYLLHFYITMGNKDKYDEYATKYFGGNVMMDSQFQYLIAEGKKGADARVSMKYALYIFVKGLYFFHCKEISGVLKKKLLQIEQTLLTAHLAEEIKGHPWEIIYKYLAFIAIQAGQTTKAEEYITKVTDKTLFPKGCGGLIENIAIYGKAQYAKLTGAHSEHSRLGNEIWRRMGYKDDMAIEAIFDVLSKKYTYMYV